jgi:hypothetical protein
MPAPPSPSRPHAAQPPVTASSAAARPGRLRLGLALAVALVSDALAVWVELLPPVQIALDVGTALLLFSILGFRWALLPPLVVEAIPGLGLFPTWLVAVGALALGRRGER